MKIGLIYHKFNGYNAKRFVKEANKKGRAVKMSPKNIFLTMDGKLSGMLGKQKLEEVKVVIPRMNTTTLQFGLMAVKHLEGMGIPCLNSYHTILLCKNKYLGALALRKKNVPQPNSALALSAKEMIKFVSKLDKPVVLKMLSGSFGIGMSKIEGREEAEEWIDTFKVFHQALYIQEYIEHEGEDYRVFVVDGKVVGCMKRIAKLGEWKTNVHLGSKLVNHKPSKEMKEIAIKAAEAVKAGYAGVDIILDEGKPKVLEVNSMAFMQGIEKATKKNIAGEIIKYAVRLAKR